MTYVHQVRIAILSSATVLGLEDVLRTTCQAAGILPEIYVSGYNRYAQDILDPASALYAHAPQLIILALDTRAIFGERYFLPYLIPDAERQRWAAERLEEITALTDALKQHSGATVVLHNFEVPLHSPFGIQESKQQFGFHESVETLNAMVRNVFKGDARVYVFNYDAFCSTVGKHASFDDKLYYLGDVKLSPRHLPALSRAYLAYIKPFLGLTKKCIVLDLDGTLWGGVLGEDGLAGIRLGPTPQGRPFLEFQQYLLSLFHRGIILAINSRNNPNDVAEAFREHPHMVLREEHFAAVRVNWEDKASNLRALAEEIAIGLDSFVFVDDDPFNRELVRRAFPEVEVVDLPEDPARYVRTFMNLDAFHAFQITSEDQERGKMYASERRRRNLRETVIDFDAYLRGLGLVVTITSVRAMAIPRVAQLTQRTNQFNMTTRRYSEQEIERFVADPRYLVCSAHARDKFGDSGITGVIIVEKGHGTWRIDTFLLSCRVIGRKIEEALLAYLIDRAARAGVVTIVGELISTSKNVPAQSFYERNGFQPREAVDGRAMFVYNVSRSYPAPAGIRIECEDVVREVV